MKLAGKALRCTIIFNALLSGALAKPQTAAASSAPNQQVSSADIIAKLGSDENDLERLKALSQRPATSARLLIAELHPVPGVRILSDEQYREKWKDTLHVIWCIRALRYLTGGLEFTAKTNHAFGSREIEQNRKWFIGGEQFPKDGTVRFFGVWMSRDSTYIAPRDAQIEIIQNWKQWYKDDGQAFPYVDSNQKQSADVWYF